MKVGKKYQAKFIGNKDKKIWCVVETQKETIICVVQSWFKDVQGVAEGIAESLNTNDKIKLNIEI